MKDSLKKRNIMKSKKPNFVRQDSNKYSFKNKWRKPRGLHNKRRLNKKGHQKNPSIGYGSPRDIKFLTKEGYKRVNINSFSDLETVDKNEDILSLSSKLGMKKKLKILERVLEMELRIENIKDIKKYIKEKKSDFEENRKKKHKKMEKKEKLRKESLKKKEEKESEGDKQKEIKEDVMKAKQKIKAVKEINVKKDTSQSKMGHKASSVPGTKQ